MSSVPNQPASQDPPNLQAEDLTLKVSATVPEASVADTYYVQEDDSEGNELGHLISAPLPPPLQELPPLQTGACPVEPLSTRRSRIKHREITKTLLLVALLAAALGLSALTVFAQTTPPLLVQKVTPSAQRGASRPIPSPRPKSTPLVTPSPRVSSWFAQNLPTSCSSIGVTQVQVDQANEEAAEFTQREEYISFQASGSLTSSANLMTNNAVKLRFVNDRRSTAVFAQELQNGPANKGLIQVPGNLQPQTALCQQQNGNVFAWVGVSFSLVIQCQTDAQGNPCPPNTQGLPEMDPQTHQPKIHTMAVLLLAVPKGTPNAPLWLGWSVSNYMIDVKPTSLALPDQP